jgi:nucleoside-diphosphate-sugar epimerase
VKVLVTGGNGFLGAAIVRELKARGHTVASASRRPSAELQKLGVRTLTCDIRNRDHVERAVEGHEAIVHTAALTGIHGHTLDFVRTNVEGTELLLDAARRHGVKAFVHTSSPSVVFDGKNHRNADESLPYPRRYLADYPRTKAQAERKVLAANSATLATIALRPHLVLGPGDTNLLPRLVARARAGKLLQVGDGTNEVSFTWIENAAAAHADALERLAPGTACAGKAYFVCQREPVTLWPWLTELFTTAGIPRPKDQLSRTSAWLAGAACELAWKAMRRASEPPMTRFLALQLATSHSYSIAALERDVGYRERVSTPEAARLLADQLRAGELTRPQLE